MNRGIQTVICPVKNLDQARTLYGTFLGREPFTDSKSYVSFKIGDQEVGLDPHGHGAGLSGPVVYWRVTNIEKRVEELLGAGAQLQQPVTDIGDGRRIARVVDADGNVLGLLQSL